MYMQTPSPWKIKTSQLIVILILLSIPKILLGQSKDMIKLEWYHYIILSPVLVIDAVRSGYKEIKNGISHYSEHRSLPELHKAVLNSDLEMVQKLNSQGVNLESKDKKGETALYYAVDQNKITIAKYLIQNKANVNVWNTNGKPLAHSAIANNQSDLIQLMVTNGLDVKSTKQGTSYLILTANLQPKNFKLIQLFINQGVDINAKDRYQYTALMHLATKDNPNLEIINYLIKKGANVNVKDPSGKSILRLLIEQRTHNLELVKTLVKNGADIDSKDNDGISIFDFINSYYDYPETNEVVIYLKKAKKNLSLR
ncbi:ankyrin repeat domain-containing protein [Leptospira jelokensis]|nr:ankyrin repeat domain-containing protein [Leptospira jelokensis]